MTDEDPQDELLLLTAYGRCPICGAPRRGWEIEGAGVTILGTTCSREQAHGPDVPPSVELPR